MDALGFANHSNKFGRYAYPKSPLERIAYTTGFYHLLKAGKTPDEIRQIFSPQFEDHPKEVNAYLARAKEEYDKDKKEGELNTILQEKNRVLGER
ncbi:MAG: hypothetical protein IJ638_01765 [Alphaproteobacteria bacterium]|nr:hypothetical protein [Alphaproteobacteria bacterium]